MFARRLDVAALVGLLEADRGAERDLAEADDQHHAEQRGRRAIASTRWPRIVSTTESEASTPTSISTNRNSIRIAPV